LNGVGLFSGYEKANKQHNKLIVNHIQKIQ